MAIENLKTVLPFNWRLFPAILQVTTARHWMTASLFSQTACTSTLLHIISFLYQTMRRLCPSPIQVTHPVIFTSSRPLFPHVVLWPLKRVHKAYPQCNVCLTQGLNLIQATICSLMLRDDTVMFPLHSQVTSWGICVTKFSCFVAQIANQPITSSVFMHWQM